MKKGLFITIEGPDGSGKTTVTSMIVDELLKNGYKVVHTREPGGIDIAEKIRNIILDPKNTNMDPKTEALLYAASRRQHLVEKVIPAIKKKQIVICERFVDSSLAYQGHARKLGIKDVFNINMFAIEKFMPNLTIYLDVDEKVGLKRIETRTNKDRLDNESLKFHHEVVKGYKIVNNKFKTRVKYVDANQDIENVVNDSLKIIYKYLHDKKYTKR